MIEGITRSEVVNFSAVSAQRQKHIGCNMDMGYLGAFFSVYQVLASFHKISCICKFFIGFLLPVWHSKHVTLLVTKHVTWIHVKENWGQVSLSRVLFDKTSLKAAFEAQALVHPAIRRHKIGGHRDIWPAHSGIILCMPPANERWRYSVTPSLIGWVHTQNDPFTPSPDVQAGSSPAREVMEILKLILCWIYCG